MKGLALINVLMLAIVMNGCTKTESAAAAYKKSKAAGESGDASVDDSLGDESSGDESSGDESSGDESSGDESSGDESSGDESTSTGDATAGKEIIESTCSSCHNSTGAGKAVTLNSAAVSRLDDAYTGTNKSFHSSFSDAFEGEGRANLEAAMKAASLRLQNSKSNK